ncbi:hypothetical protein B0H13DRAFT_2541358 [Mycena leptocephala]|nr:hypothetical protein B0H13DRAFT_2541358 [Mycena leptocephala]
MRALPWTPDSMPDPWVELEGARVCPPSSASPESSSAGGKRRECGFGDGLGWPRPHTHSPLALLHATPRRLLLGGAGCILNSASSITRPFLYRYRFEPDPLGLGLSRVLVSLYCPATPDTQAAAAPTLDVRSVLHIGLYMYPTILSVAHPRSAFRRCPVCAALAARMHTASTAHASAFPQPSRTIFALVVQACFPVPATARTVHVVLPVSRTHARSVPDGTPVSTLLHAARSHSPLAPCAIRIVCALCSPPYRCAYLPLPSLPSLLGLLQTLSVALTCVLLSQHVSHPTSIQIVPPPVFLLSLAFRLVLAAARRSHSLDSIS